MWFQAHNLFILICCIVECIIFLPFNIFSRNGNKCMMPLIILRNLKCLFWMLIFGRKPSTNENIITKYRCHIMQWYFYFYDKKKTMKTRNHRLWGSMYYFVPIILFFMCCAWSKYACMDLNVPNKILGSHRLQYFGGPDL